MFLTQTFCNYVLGANVLGAIVFVTQADLGIFGFRGTGLSGRNFAKRWVAIVLTRSL